MTSITPLRRVLDAARAMVDCGVPGNAEGLCHYSFQYEEERIFDNRNIPRFEVVSDHLPECLWKALRDAIESYEKGEGPK